MYFCFTLTLNYFTFIATAVLSGTFDKRTVNFDNLTIHKRLGSLVSDGGSHTELIEDSSFGDDPEVGNFVDRAGRRSQSPETPEVGILAALGATLKPLLLHDQALFSLRPPLVLGEDVVMLAELEHAPVGHQVRHDVLVVVVQLPLGLGREIVEGEVHQVRPAQVHPLETLGAGVAEGADEQPEAVAGDDGHVVGARRQTPLVEPLTAAHTLHHLAVPRARTPAVTVGVLNKNIC